MAVGKMAVGKMTVGKMAVGKMTCCLKASNLMLPLNALCHSKIWRSNSFLKLIFL
jgi:hypothetical protein